MCMLVPTLPLPSPSPGTHTPYHTISYHISQFSCAQLHNLSSKLHHLQKDQESTVDIKSKLRRDNTELRQRYVCMWAQRSAQCVVIKRGEGEGVSTQMGTCNSFCAGSNLAMILGTLFVSPSIHVHVCFQETAVSFCACRFMWTKMQLISLSMQFIVSWFLILKGGWANCDYVHVDASYVNVRNNVMYKDKRVEVCTCTHNNVHVYVCTCTCTLYLVYRLCVPICYQVRGSWREVEGLGAECTEATEWVKEQAGGGCGKCVQEVGVVSVCRRWVCCVNSSWLGDN